MQMPNCVTVKLKWPPTQDPPAEAGGDKSLFHNDVSPASVRGLQPLESLTVTARSHDVLADGHARSLRPPSGATSTGMPLKMSKALPFRNSPLPARSLANTASD